MTGALGTVTKRLVKGLVNLEIRVRIETIQNTVLLRLARILRRILEICIHSNSNERTPSNAGVKNPKKSKIIIMMIIIWYIHSASAVLENDTHKLIWDFNMQTDYQISARLPELIIISKKKKTCKIVYFAVSADHRVWVKGLWKEGYVLGPCLGFLKKWNMKVTFTPIIIGALSTVTEELLKGLGNLEIRGHVGTIQSITLLIPARILRRVPETWGDLLSLKLQW